VEETGGKIFRSNGKRPGDDRIALIADPLGTEIENRNEGTLDVPKVISTAPTSS
jgi:intein/homing endonuclease